MMFLCRKKKPKNVKVICFVILNIIILIITPLKADQIKKQLTQHKCYYLFKYITHSTYFFLFFLYFYKSCAISIISAQRYEDDTETVALTCLIARDP